MKQTVFYIMFFVVIFACSKDQNPTESGTGTLHVRLTDAPAIYDSVNIDITGVEVHSDQTGGWVSMALPAPGIYDLLRYRNGLDTLIATTDIPAGNVSQIRLILGARNSVTKNGQTYPLIIPSGSESGLKLQIHTTIVQGVTTVVLLDFDASRSIVEQGNGSFHLKPVIRTITTGIDGAIAGRIAPPMTALAYAIAGTDSFSTIVDPSTGNFLIRGVPAGTYTVCIYPAAVFQDTCISNVVVTTNAQTNLGIIQY
ncbi:MAG TPA: DUF4382 domain-containing protein [Bacteroidia bacterium]|nr:DUF4382 domain-containing protein [Bacteroidia bacterium]